MRKNPSYMALLRPTRLLISEKFATYTIKWSYTIIWQVRVLAMAAEVTLGCKFGNKISNFSYIFFNKKKAFTIKFHIYFSIKRKCLPLNVILVINSVVH